MESYTIVAATSLVFLLKWPLKIIRRNKILCDDDRARMNDQIALATSCMCDFVWFNDSWVLCLFIEQNIIHMRTSQWYCHAKHHVALCSSDSHSRCSRNYRFLWFVSTAFRGLFLPGAHFFFLSVNLFVIIDRKVVILEHTDWRYYNRNAWITMFKYRWEMWKMSTVVTIRHSFRELCTRIMKRIL